MQQRGARWSVNQDGGGWASARSGRARTWRSRQRLGRWASGRGAEASWSVRAGGEERAPLDQEHGDRRRRTRTGAEGRDGVPTRFRRVAPGRAEPVAREAGQERLQPRGVADRKDHQRRAPEVKARWPGPAAPRGRLVERLRVEGVEPRAAPSPRRRLGEVGRRREGEDRRVTVRSSRHRGAGPRRPARRPAAGSALEAHRAGRTTRSAGDPGRGARPPRRTEAIRRSRNAPSTPRPEHGRQAPHDILGRGRRAARARSAPRLARADRRRRGELELGIGAVTAGTRSASRAPTPIARSSRSSSARRSPRQLREKAERRGHRNLVAIRGDGRVLAPRLFAAGSLAAVHVHFPDPWWKRRHGKRRLVDDGMSRLVLGLLAPGGLLNLPHRRGGVRARRRRAARGGRLRERGGPRPVRRAAGDESLPRARSATSRPGSRCGGSGSPAYPRREISPSAPRRNPARARPRRGRLRSPGGARRRLPRARRLRSCPRRQSRLEPARARHAGLARRHVRRPPRPRHRGGFREREGSSSSVRRARRASAQGDRGRARVGGIGPSSRSRAPTAPRAR